MKSDYWLQESISLSNNWWLNVLRLISKKKLLDFLVGMEIYCNYMSQKRTFNKLNYDLHKTSKVWMFQIIGLNTDRELILELQDSLVC
jgi:hypothetical protein